MLKKILYILIGLVGIVIGKVAVQELFQNETTIISNQEALQRLDNAIENNPELLAIDAMKKEASKMSDEVLASTNTDEYKLNFSAGSYLGFYLINTRTRKYFCAKHDVDISEFTNEFINQKQDLYIKAKTILESYGLSEDKFYSEELLSQEKIINIDMQEISDIHQIPMEDVCKLFNERAAFIVSEIQFYKTLPEAYKILVEHSLDE